MGPMKVAGPVVDGEIRDRGVTVALAHRMHDSGECLHRNGEPFDSMDVAVARMTRLRQKYGAETFDRAFARVRERADAEGIEVYEAAERMIAEKEAEGIQPSEAAERLIAEGGG